METKTMSFRDTIILAMSEEMRRDENVFLMGEDVGVFGGDFGTSVGMLEEFGPERVRDCPISEAAISGAAAGAAMTGLRPIVDMTFMDFSVIAMDNIVNQAAKTRYMFGGKGQVPMTVRMRCLVMELVLQPSTPNPWNLGLLTFLDLRLWLQVHLLT